MHQALVRCDLALGAEYFMIRVSLCLTRMMRTSSLMDMYLCRDSSGAEQKPEELCVGGSIPSPGTMLCL